MNRYGERNGRPSDSTPPGGVESGFYTGAIDKKITTHMEAFQQILTLASDDSTPNSPQALDKATRIHHGGIARRTPIGMLLGERWGLTGA